MNPKPILFVCGMILMLALIPLRANGLTEEEGLARIESANAAYQQGLFNDALELYLGVYEAGLTSASLCYNIGNTYYKLNRIPESILFYERALLLSPSDQDVRDNLALAQTRIIDKIESVPELFFIRWWNQVRNAFGADGWSRMSIILFGIFLLFLFSYLLSKKPLIKQLAFWPGLISLLLFAHALAFAWQKSTVMKNHPEAIVFQASVTAKSSPDAGSVDLFVIHEGTKVRIQDQIGDWVEIKIASGNRGWMKEKALERI